MELIGIIEKKKGNEAIILVKKILPCGDKCKSCSAGCKLFSIHIQKEVDDSLNVGDCVKVLQKDEKGLNSSVMQGIIPAFLVIGSIIIVQLIPQLQNKGVAIGLAILVSIIVTHYVLKLYDRMQMKKYANHFIVGEKCGQEYMRKD